MIDDTICSKCKVNPRSASRSKLCFDCRKIQRIQKRQERQRRENKHYLDARAQFQKSATTIEAENIRQRTRLRRKRLRVPLKMEALRAYGGEFCISCGEARLECLELDHIWQNGAEDRRSIEKTTGVKGFNMYIYLKRKGWPPGFRVLCSSCNKSAFRNSGVPRVRQVHPDFDEKKAPTFPINMPNYYV